MLMAVLLQPIANKICLNQRMRVINVYMNYQPNLHMCLFRIPKYTTTLLISETLLTVLFQDNVIMVVCSLCTNVMNITGHKICKFYIIIYVMNIMCRLIQNSKPQKKKFKRE